MALLTTMSGLGSRQIKMRLKTLDFTVFNFELSDDFGGERFGQAATFTVSQ